MEISVSKAFRVKIYIFLKIEEQELNVLKEVSVTDLGTSCAVCVEAPADGCEWITSGIGDYSTHTHTHIKTLAVF